MAEATATKKGFKISADLLKTIVLTDDTRRARLEEGVTYQIAETGETELENKVEYPVYLLNNKIRINLFWLSHLLVDSDDVPVDSEGLLPYGTDLKPMRFLHVLNQTNEVPSEITVSRRILQGANAGYFENEEYGDSRRTAYELKDINIEGKESFPLLLIKRNGDENDPDAWRKVSKVFIKA